MSKRIRIAVDARPLEGDLTGIGQYTSYLLHELCALDRYEWFLLSNQPLDEYELYRNSHVHCISSGITFPKAGTFLSQSKFPFWCRNNKIDLFWSPRHHLPLALSPRIVQIVTVHDVIWKKVPETMKRERWILEALLMPSSLRKANHIIVDSHSTKKDLIDLFSIETEKLSVIPLGPTVMAGSYPKDKGKPYILFVGTLETRKNLPRLLSAYQQMSSDLRQKYDLVIIGGRGWGKNNIQLLSDELGISSNVRIKGYLKKKDMTTLLANAEMLTMPSLYEGFGLPLLDAMTLGVPIMTSNISSMPEVTGSAALLIDPYSRASMRDAMEKLLTDNRLKEKLVARGMKRAEQFSWQQAASETALIFEKTIETARSVS